jgi:hypothetical protein
MTAKTVSPENSNRRKNPDDWITGDEEMTGAKSRICKLLRRKPMRMLNPI